LTQQLKRTSLYHTHLSLGARMVPFAGWEMPVQYTGILAEVRAVRGQCGLFDVSHMGRLDISGADATALLEWVVTNDVSGLQQGRARYAFICNPDGGVIDDCIYYRRDVLDYLLVCNASNRESVAAWLERWIRERGYRVSVADRTEATAMIAFQGPRAVPILDGLTSGAASSIRPFAYGEAGIGGTRAFVGRTGYTGEDGAELVVSAEAAPAVWRLLMENGATPCGLGARDVLRLEAALMLHGIDIDTATSPLEAGQERFVRLEKEFAGVEALRRQKTRGLTRRLVGLKLSGNQIARHGYAILSEGRQVGQVTSGTYSPTLEASIAMGYVGPDHAAAGQPPARTGGQRLAIDLRGRPVEAVVTSLPFYSGVRSA
jgi:aminomethyltransferase